jgi:hypothetical protein
MCNIVKFRRSSQDSSLVDRQMVGAIDLHCHSGPSLMPRAWRTIWRIGSLYSRRTRHGYFPPLKQRMATRQSLTWSNLASIYRRSSESRDIKRWRWSNATHTPTECIFAWRWISYKAGMRKPPDGNFWCATPPELHKTRRACAADPRKPLKHLVGRAGFEPATNGLKVRCSTS